MTSLIKNIDIVLIEHETAGKIFAGYYQSDFYDVNPFLRTGSAYDINSVKKVYMPNSKGVLEPIDVKEFRAQYKLVKNTVA